MAKRSDTGRRRMGRIGAALPERAVFVNLLEVALNCHLDVPVRFGDCAVAYGQGSSGASSPSLPAELRAPWSSSLPTTLSDRETRFDLDYAFLGRRGLSRRSRSAVDGAGQDRESKASSVTG